MSAGEDARFDATGVTLASQPVAPGSTADVAAVMAGAGEDRTLAGEVSGTDATMMADLAELRPGAVIDRYRITSRLGAGGMGVVYQAHDTQLDRDVALKVLRVGEDGTEGRTRMLREAKAAAKIRHPNVVTVYDAGEVFGRVFIAMELIDGVTLKAHFRGRKRLWREVIEVMLAAGEGLAAAHAAGLVHRDFKPDNVLVEAGGRVRVLDFGLARAVGEIEGSTLQTQDVGIADGSRPVLQTLTQTGMLVGTPAYMAPEQHLARGVDARTDQFAFCVTCFECLFGHRPFAGETQAALTLNVVEGRMLGPRERGDVPGEVVAALQRGLSVDPADRHPSVPELLALLRASAQRRAPRGRRTLMIAAGLLVPLTLAGALYGSGREARAPGRGPAAGRAKEVKEVEEVKEVKEGAQPLAGATPGAGAQVPPERRGVTIKAPSSFPARDFAELIAGILPAGLEVTLDPSGVRVIGEEAGRWEDPLSMVRTLLDTDNSRGPAVLLVTQFKTPDGFCGLYLLQAEAYAATHTQALLAVPGVRRVGRSAGLRALLVLGEGKAQTEAGALMQRMAAPS